MFPKAKIISLFTLLLLFSPHFSLQSSPTVCIIGSGIGGSSLAYFLRLYSQPTTPPPQIHIFERHGVVGGRMATVTIAGETFEADASILHPKNYHAVNFTKLLNLKAREPSSSDESDSFGIWDGEKFVFKTLGVDSRIPFVQKMVSYVNALYMLARYGLSLFKMQRFVESMVDRFLKYYESFDTRPVFESVDEMLKWAGLYNLTRRSLKDELVDVKLSPLLTQELVTVSFHLLPLLGNLRYGGKVLSETVIAELLRAYDNVEKSENSGREALSGLYIIVVLIHLIQLMVEVWRILILTWSRAILIW